MWLLNALSYELESFEGVDVPRYAILSHRWGHDELTFKDMLKKRFWEKEGFQKVKYCCEQAILEGLSYVWIDTCCIDKRSSAELSEAINSMYDWYSKSTVCYAYLSDVRDDASSGSDITTSAWFTRGWTLQELLAPMKLFFYDDSWKCLGSKSDHAAVIHQSTSIPTSALTYFEPSEWSALQKMLWAAGRKTTRIEDKVYSLLGLFGVNMPLLYGEGHKAFARLQQHIAASSDDLSIFGWTLYPEGCNSMFASSQQCFRDSFPVKYLGESASSSTSTISLDDIGAKEFQALKMRYTYTTEGIEGSFPLVHHVFNIHRLCIADSHYMLPDPSSKAIQLCIFVEYDARRAVYRRVSFEGHNCIALRGDHSNFRAKGRTPIKIVHEEIPSVSSTHFGNAEWRRFLGWAPLTIPVNVSYVCTGWLVAADAEQRSTPPLRPTLSTTSISSYLPCLVFSMWGPAPIASIGELKVIVHFAYDRPNEYVGVLFSTLSSESRLGQSRSCGLTQHDAEHLQSSSGQCVVLRPPLESAGRLSQWIDRIRSKSLLKERMASGSSNTNTNVTLLASIDLGRIELNSYKIEKGNLRISQFPSPKSTTVYTRLQFLLEFDHYVPGVEGVPAQWVSHPGLASSPYTSVHMDRQVSALNTWPGRSIFKTYRRS